MMKKYGSVKSLIKTCKSKCVNELFRTFAALEANHTSSLESPTKKKKPA